MRPDKSLDLNFDIEELSSSTYKSDSEMNSNGEYLEQVSVYRAQYAAVLLENNELQKKVLSLREKIRVLESYVKE